MGYPERQRLEKHVDSNSGITTFHLRKYLVLISPYPAKAVLRAYRDMKSVEISLITLRFDFKSFQCLFSQCIDNIRCNGLMTIVFEENSKVTVPHMIK